VHKLGESTVDSSFGAVASLGEGRTAPNDTIHGVTLFDGPL